MICFLRRSTIDYDIRLRKYVNICDSENIPYVAITWDRLLNSQILPGEIQYKHLAPYGMKLRNLWGLIGWFFFVYYHLFKSYKKYRVIHACNLEMFLLALPFKLLGKSIILDIYDSMDIKLERNVSKWADLLILPHERRLEQIDVRQNQLKDFLVVENVPLVDYIFYESNKNHCETKSISLSYVGVLEQNIRGIENLLDVVKNNPNLSLNIAGVGGGLEQLVIEYSQSCDRIIYHGKVDYSTALRIMRDSDIIVALYYSFHKDHKYASPNKYYESLFLGTPILTSQFTLVGDQVSEENTGYTIGDTAEDLDNFFATFNWSAYTDKARRCRELWQDKYADYRNAVLRNQYLYKVKRLHSH